eukprot:scaffold4868_cov416-Prasinococcus_capsulatus_cf.AAC.31
MIQGVNRHPCDRSQIFCTAQGIGWPCLPGLCGFSCAAYLHNLYHILVLESVVLADSLRPMLHRGTPNERVLEVLHQALVDTVTEVLHGILVLETGIAPCECHYWRSCHDRCYEGTYMRDDDRLIVIGKKAFGLGVYAQQVEMVPYLFKQAI